MTASSVTFAEARRISPEGARMVADAADAWVATISEPDGSTRVLPRGTDVRLEGFGSSVQIVVALDPTTSQPVYDTVTYTKSPGVAIVAFGRDAHHVLRFLWLSQERPFADNPDATDGKAGCLIFGQIPTGFIQIEPGQDVIKAIADGACRELREETGVARVLNVEVPTPIVYWHDPTHFTNVTYVAFVEVDLSTLSRPACSHEDGERIREVEQLTIGELFARIQKGRTADGVIHQMGLSLGPLMMFLAYHPELFREAI